MEVRTLQHKDIEKTVAPEEVVSVNFIEAIIKIIVIGINIIKFII